MRVRQIRSACSVITYAGKDFLVDPWLAPKDSKPAFPFAAYQKRRHPRAELPCSIEELIQSEVLTEKTGDEARSQTQDVRSAGNQDLARSLRNCP